ncbi:hypothetical protein ACNPM6_003389 [Vibrio parahaemolyticus]|nr:hypothetical protein [Vibrio parahaemolyticus]
MNNQTKSKITRTLYAALLDSKLNNQEILEFCDDILSGSNYMHELAYTLKQQLENSYLFGANDYDEDEISNQVEEAYSDIRAQKISKSELLDRLSMYDPTFYHNQSVNRKSTIRKLLKEFLLSTSDEVWNHFKDSITPDHYFRGIGKY